jgi:Domain of unknown function (DUF397)
MGVQTEWYSPIAWRKSTQSADQGNCVEVANGLASVLVRDSQDRPGPMLVLSPGQWRQLLRHVRSRGPNYG